MNDTIITLESGTSKLLFTAGKYCDGDIIINALEGESPIQLHGIKTDSNIFSFTLKPGTSKRLLTKNKYCDRNIVVTSTGVQPAVMLDIENGPIVITDTGYSQNSEEETPWRDNIGHEITVTGTSDGSNNIVLKGGNPIITIENVNITVTEAATPALLLYGGTGAGIERAVKASLILAGDNSILCYDSTPIQININAVLTIFGDGILHVETNRGNTPGIGAGDSNPLAYTSATANVARNNAYRNTGNLIVSGGTINAVGNGRGTNQRVAAIGDSYYANFGGVTVKGGTLNLSNKDLNGTGISGDTISIDGGLINDNTGGSRGGIDAQNSFKMSSGTIRTEATLRLATTDTTISVTGGNIGTLYTGEIPGRTRAKISFISSDGFPISNTEIFVSEASNEWSALTDENGIVYTYLDENTTVIRAGLSYEQKSDVIIADGEGVYQR